jgi:hypothetical protein
VLLWLLLLWRLLLASPSMFAVEVVMVLVVKALVAADLSLPTACIVCGRAVALWLGSKAACGRVCSWAFVQPCFWTAVQQTLTCNILQLCGGS